LSDDGPRDIVSGRVKPVLAYFGHHRCATTWLDGIFGAIARELRLRYASYHASWMFADDLRAHVDRHRLDCIAYTNADYRHVAGLAPYRGFHVIRDPRDVAVSCYFSHRYSHPLRDDWPELAERRARLARLSQAEGLLSEIEALDGMFACLRGWRYDDPDILELRMEALIADPYQHLLRVCRFLGVLDPARFTLARRAASTLAKGFRTVEGLSGERIRIPFGPQRIPAERVLGIAWEHAFEHLSGGRSRGDEDPYSHFRKGTPGDWRRHFTPEHVAAWKARYPGLLADLGYEHDDRWDLDAPGLPCAAAAPLQR